MDQLARLREACERLAEPRPICRRTGRRSGKRKSQDLLPSSPDLPSRGLSETRWRPWRRRLATLAPPVISIAHVCPSLASTIRPTAEYGLRHTFGVSPRDGYTPPKPTVCQRINWDGSAPTNGMPDYNTATPECADEAAARPVLPFCGRGIIDVVRCDRPFTPSRPRPPTT